MTQEGMDFSELEMEGRERLDDILEEMDQEVRGRGLARIIRTLQ